MPNGHRDIQPGSIYHLIIRFVGNEWLMAGPDERANYLRLLGHALARSDWSCLSYGLMSSHVHLAARAGLEPMGSWMRRVHSPFGEWINARNRRIGAVFVRPSDYLVSPSRVGDALAYIHNNPVRAGVVDQAATSDWTSHRAYLGLVQPPSWLDVQLGLALSGFSDIKAFDAWTHLMPDARPHLDPAQLARASRARAAAKLARVSGPTRAGRATHASPPASAVIDAALAALGKMAAPAGSSDRDPFSVAFRQVAIHSGLSLGVPQDALASALGVSQQAVSKAGKRALEATALERAYRSVLVTLGREPTDSGCAKLGTTQLPSA